MKNSKTVWLLPFRYPAPAALEQYFEQMEAGGWHIERLTQFSSIVQTFRRGAPQKYRYVVDMNAFPKRDYTSTYQAFGWELVGKMASVYIWRMPYTVTRPEAFTDRQSRLDRSGRFPA